MGKKTNHFKKNREQVKKGEFLVASQWQLMRWKFFRHRTAIVALVVLSVFYFCALFAQFISPNYPRLHDKQYIFSPPSPLPSFFDEKGKFRLRPFVYGMKGKLEMETLTYTYTVDRSKKYPLYFFVEGDPYKFWGLFDTNVHLFGLKGTKIYLFGADAMGRDLFSRNIFAAQISLSIGLVGVAITLILGITLGGISGYFGGKIDLIIQRIVEFIRSIPQIPLWLALSVALPPRWSVTKVYFGIVVILSVFGWTVLARVVRGKFLSLREEDFVTAAKLSGASEVKIIFKHLLPSFSSHIIAYATLSVPMMIVGETTLSFLGLGLRSPAVSWGVLLKDAQSIPVLASHLWLLIPSVFVIVAVLCFNFIGDAVRDAADPYAVV